MMQNTSMRTKLFVCFGFVAIAATASALYSVAKVRNLQEQMRVEIVGSAARLDQARQITIGLTSMRSAMRGISLFAITHNAELFQKARAAFDSNAADMRKTVQQMEAGDIRSEERASVDAIRSSLEQWVANFQEFADLSSTGRAEEASAITATKTTPLMDTIQKYSQDFGQANSARRDAAILAAQAAIQHNEALTFVFIALVLLAGGGGFVVVTGMAKTLREISESVAVGAQQVSQAAAQVSTSSQSLAQGSAESAASLEETSASVEEIQSMARRNTENSQNAAGIVGHSAEKFSETNQALDEMVVAMGEITGSSRKISKIIKVIDEIAFQTNILALERRSRSGAGWRSRNGVRGGCRRGAQPGAALRPGCQGYLRSDRGVHCQVGWRKIQGGPRGGGTARCDTRGHRGQDAGR